MPQRGDELLASRRAKLERLRQRDIDPYPARFHRTHTTAEAARAFTDAEAAGGDSPAATIAGRVVRLRRMGKASFADERLFENLSTLVSEIVRVKPPAAKGTYLRNLSVSSTMGPGVRVDVSRVDRLFTARR